MKKLDEIKERCEKATPGPWELYFATGEPWQIIRSSGSGEYRKYEEHVYPANPHAKHNTDFIVNSRDDIPWLIEQVENLQHSNEELKCKLIRAIESGEEAVSCAKKLQSKYEKIRKRKTKKS